MADALAASQAGVLRVLTCGSVDDGKSTLIGRLLFECGQVPDDVLATLRRDSAQWGTTDGAIDYALLVDGLAAEREQGITIDVAYRFFDTPRRRCILADTPGHEQYTRNMVTAASTAELAILLVDVRRGLLAQTRRHAAIAALLGVRRIVLAVNKIDLAGYNKASFDAVADDFAAFARRLGLAAPTAIPICARDGDNVTVRSTATGWYHGPTLLEALDHPAPAAVAEAAFRMPVQWVNRPDATFRGFSGSVAAGAVWPGRVVYNVTAGTSAEVARVVTFDGDLATAGPGAAVTLVLDREIDVARGDVLAAAPLPAVADQVTARLVWMDETPLFPGRAYLVMLGARTLAATVDSVESRLNVDTLQDEPARDLTLNEIGRVGISFAAPVAFEPYRASRTLGSFIMIDRLTNATVGAGMIESGETRSSNVHWHRLDVDKPSRAALKHQRPAVLWFTGLSGAGKSTIANLVERRLHAMGRHTMLLDGDNVRHGLNRDLGFSEADRVENIRRVAEVAKLFVEAGLIVLVSFISPYRSERLLARERVAEDEFLEIYVDTPIEECRKRDPKGLYARADAGQIANFTGIDAPYEPPEAAEIHLRTLSEAPAPLADRVVEELRRRQLFD